MIAKITNKSDYILACEVGKLPISYDTKMNVKLFGNDILVDTDDWLHHFHIKITDDCNAKCDFCVEQNCKRKENPLNALKNIDKMLNEMSKNNILFSVSVTGGEPTLFPYFNELCNILKKHPIKFLTMNTNGYGLRKFYKEIDEIFDFVNISRHSCTDDVNDKIFNTQVITVKGLKEIKDLYNHTKFRIQCVLGNEINSISDVEKFIKTYSFADDFSFRKLMTVNEEFGLRYNPKDKQYFKLLKYAFDNWEFKEQNIQDYYVYEIYNNGKFDITFSYSNMKLLRNIEKEEADNIYREFICHPDGTVSGSWKKDCKIILT